MGSSRRRAVPPTSRRGRVPTRSIWVLAAALASLASLAIQAALAPNQLLGTCLDETWVAAMETKLGVSRNDRDALGRLAHPFLQPALKHPRFRVRCDQCQSPLWCLYGHRQCLYTLIVLHTRGCAGGGPRTSDPNVYAADCMPSGTAVYGVGAQVDVNNKVIRKGVLNGSVVVELNGGVAHTTNSLLFSILATEVYGYQVSFYSIGWMNDATQRMSSVRSGKCTPTHVNLEVWANPARERNLAVYANELYVAGQLGYLGYSGIYTTVDFIARGADSSIYSPTFYADFWKDYVRSNKLLSALGYDKFTRNSAYYPIKEAFCADGSFGCKDGCSKSFACTQREASGGKCMVVLLMYDYYDPGYVQAALSNLNVPTYFCFIGHDGLEQYVLEAQTQGLPVVFYHYMPDVFILRNAGLFQRVFLPYPTPESVIKSTGTYDENGYGQKTDNTVAVDFPATRIFKYASGVIQSALPLQPFVSKYTLSDLNINDLIQLWFETSKDPNEPAPEFRAACNWIKANYDVWKLWLDRAPLCTRETHMAYDVRGCEITSRTRSVEFKWKDPSPQSASKPFVCDGEFSTLPPAIVTSRSCTWILEDERRWIDWIAQKPVCDASFYDYSISACDSSAKRRVTFFWLLANVSDPTASAECRDGVSLPPSLLVNCEYMPMTTSTFTGILVITLIVAILLIAAMVFVYKHRNTPVIKRSQYELLELMLLGGVFVCIAAIVYAGKPSYFLCGVRPVAISTGFTTIFSSLIVKSLRVYRVFMKSAMKRIKVSLFMMLKFFLLFFAVDVLIITVWFAVDFPAPTTTVKPAFEFRGEIDEINCASSSFIFSALLIFWKAILLFMGLYISFLVRNISGDFQESMWIFASALVVLIGSLVIIPLTYLVDLAAAPFYVFLSITLLFCTLLVMLFMLAPKVLRLNALMSRRSDATSTDTQGNNPNKSVRAKFGTSYVVAAQSDAGSSTTTTHAAVAKKKEALVMSDIAATDNVGKE